MVQMVQSHIGDVNTIISQCCNGRKGLAKHITPTDVEIMWKDRSPQVEFFNCADCNKASGGFVSEKQGLYNIPYWNKGASPG